MIVWRIDCASRLTGDSIALFYRTELAAQTALIGLPERAWDASEPYEEDFPIGARLLPRLTAAPWPCLDPAAIVGLLDGDPKREAAEQLNSLLGLPRQQTEETEAISNHE